ncbi:MAG TPA: serine/threonine-protein kinase, partial [Polyangiaceae bacterium]|nr:serine/threonine-protein kinase [Polyangiaceae bacterium]
SRLRHPNAVSVYDSGRTRDGSPYYVMEYLDGLDLERLVAEQGPLSPARTIRVLGQVCGALGELHALGLVHRDIKPANIMLSSRAGESEVAKVVDYGLARAVGDDSDETSVISGTPLYLAPEAVTHPASVDARADIYALGAVAYFLLTGQHVFQGNSVVEVLGGHLFEAPVPPSERLAQPLPAALEALVLRCLAKDPAARPASAEALLAELSAVSDGLPAAGVPVAAPPCDFGAGRASSGYGQRVRLLAVATTERYRSAGSSLGRRTASLAEERLAG